MKMQFKLLSAMTCLGLLAFLVTAQTQAQAQGVVKIGEVNSYKAQAAFLEPYKKGMELAVEQINAAGGVNGRKIELITRDDNANPGDAVRAAEELVAREKIDVLTGTFLSNTGLAVADFAKQKKLFFLAGEPLTDKMTWQGGNQYTFRLRPGTYMQAAMLVPEAVKLNKKRWAIVYPNYEYGQSAVAAFKQLLKAAQPDVEFVAEQATPLGKVDAGSVAQALADAKPDAIFNVLFGADLLKFVREGNTRGLFKDRTVVSVLTGEPEYLAHFPASALAGTVCACTAWRNWPRGCFGAADVVSTPRSAAHCSQRWSWRTALFSIVVRFTTASRSWQLSQTIRPPLGTRNEERGTSHSSRPASPATTD